MKYMVLMYGAENCWNDEERKDCMVGCLQICDELTARGRFIATSPLQSVSTAKTIRVQDGRQLTLQRTLTKTSWF